MHRIPNVRDREPARPFCFIAVTHPKGKVEYPAGNLAPDQLEAVIIVRFMRKCQSNGSKAPAYSRHPYPVTPL